MPRHILIKLTRRARDKQQIAYNWIPKRLTADLLAETP